MKKLLLAVPAALLIATALTACGSSGQTSEQTSGAGAAPAASSAPAAAAPQTVEEACKIAQEQAASFSEKYQNAASELGNDPEAAVAKLKEMTGELSSIGDSLTNPDVSAAWDSFVTAFDGIAQAAESSDMNAFSESSTALMDAATKMGEVCPTN